MTGKSKPKPDGLRFRAPLMQGYVSVPRTVMRDQRLSLGARVLYSTICDYARESNCAWPSELTLAGHLGCSDRQVRRYLAELTGLGLVTTVRESRVDHNQYVIEPDYAPGQHPDLDPPADERTPVSSRDRTSVSDATGRPCPPKEKQRKSSRERASASDLKAQVHAVAERLKPLVDAGRLDDPLADGSEMAILVALQGSDAEHLDAALQRIAAWAADGNLRTRALARLLPTALEQSRSNRRHGDGTSGDRPSWDDTATVLRAAVARHGRDQLAALQDLAEHHPAAARVVVELGGWAAWCDTRNTGDWAAHCLRTYQAMSLDPQPVTDLIAQLEHNAAVRAALDAGTNPYDPEVSA